MGGGSSKNKQKAAEQQNQAAAKQPTPAAGAEEQQPKGAQAQTQENKGAAAPTPPQQGLGDQQRQTPPQANHKQQEPGTRGQGGRSAVATPRDSQLSGHSTDRVRRFSTAGSDANLNTAEDRSVSDDSVRSAWSGRPAGENGHAHNNRGKMAAATGPRGRDYSKISENVDYDAYDSHQGHGRKGHGGRRASGAGAADDNASDCSGPGGSKKQQQTFLLNGENIEFRYPSGSTFVGGFRDGKLHGFGRYCYYPSGDVYEGEWFNDMKHGKGVYTYESGDKYSGEWRQGKKHGIGRYTFASGDEYNGQWTQDRINGHGTFTIVKTGNKYDGQWVDSYRHGHGVLYSGNGDVYDGNWQRGKENGLGALTYSSGAMYCGEWKNGQMDGKGCVLDSRNMWSLVEHINGYMISNVQVAANRDIEREYQEVWEYAQGCVKKKKGGQVGGGGGGGDSEVLARLREENKELQTRYDNLVNKMQASEAAAGQLASDDLRDQLTYYMNQCTVQEGQLGDLDRYKQEADRLRAELEDANAQLAKRQEEIEDLQNEVSQLEKEMASGIAAQQDAGDVAAEKREQEALQRSSKAHEKELKEVTAKLTALEKQAAKDSEAWKRREEGLLKDVDREKESTKRVEQQLLKEIEILKMGGNKQSEALEKYQVEMQQKSAELQRLSDERLSKIEMLEKELDAARAELATLTGELTAANAKGDDLEKALEQANQDRDGRTKELDEKNKKHKKKIKELEQKIKEAKELEENLRKALEASNKKTETANARIEELDLLYDQEKKKARRLFNQIEDMKGKIRVYLRARPLSNSERERGSTNEVLTFPDEYGCKVYDEGNKATREEKDYLFDRCFPQDSTQEDVFDDCKHLMQSAVDGFNVCIFAYGQTGSGKTFTLEGSDTHPGVAPRAMQELFAILKALGSGFEVKVTCYMVELYNDRLQDLLAGTPASKEQGKDMMMPKPSEGEYDKQRLDIKKDVKGIVTVAGVTMLDAGTGEELLSLYDQGKKNRKTRATKMNDASSRSHLVFSVIVETTNLDTRSTNVGKLSVVDLAGSERLNKTGIKDKTAIQEATSINSSLSALGNVISALSSGERGAHIPYRDSKLTMLMSDSLGGNAKTLMFVNVSPSNYNTEETVSSLNYASRVKLIKNNPQRTIETAEIKRLKQQIEKLRAGQRAEGDFHDIADGVAAGDAEEPGRGGGGGGRDQSPSPAVIPDVGKGGRKSVSPARRPSKAG